MLRSAGEALNRPCGLFSKGAPASLFPLLAFGLFLLLELHHFFFGHLIILARGKHCPAAPFARSATDPPPLFLGEQIAADRLLDCAGLDQQFTYFFQEIVEVIRLERIWK